MGCWFGIATECVNNCDVKFFICVLPEVNSIRAISNNTPTVTYLLEYRSVSLGGRAVGLLSHSLLPRGLTWCGKGGNVHQRHLCDGHKNSYII
jgi:hypothetical protein